MRVVGAVLVRGGTVLAARRSAPPELAGRWEFPGGKLDDGETAADALVRECREELGVEIEPLAHLGTAGAGAIELELWSARLRSGEPRALQDHDRLRWLSGAELDTLDWLPIDRALLPAVRALLA